MEKHIFSYKNNGSQVVNVIIEPWIMVYEIKPLSTIVFTYTSNEKKLKLLASKTTA